ncbi:hypothetical protein Kpol_2002p52 [Vanderwaltozyma polyspora DSM 70294]|uniref:Cell division control protein n=1 Tax=Vanderwaltozyma polyspora (strain ATCC 22028 / DSM 70294 / BCRC 21397 / CBS 2163 / NBRC 10782 / NRRL Y-8283 / UCD 57-17) TaxID=436907 RepID=A7TFG7_VANPO|nr:uncharacterized protein Kpol_2002p52 [Vanderwaltozyma polyspora DSM 70294]EDO18981.1 hypothetical protein Kpol_2002p52 [Vanderwaltozyma polyspora DSM 70294]
MKRPCPVTDTPVKKRKYTLPITPDQSPVKQKLSFDQSLYSRTKAVLQRSTAINTTSQGSLVTRQSHHSTLIEFLDNAIQSGNSDSLYITGPPGTGKTAQVQAIIRDNFQPIPIPNFDQSNTTTTSKLSPKKNNISLSNLSYYTLPNGTVKKVATVVINCIALNEESSIFNKIYNSFNSHLPSSIVSTMSHLQDFFKLYSHDTSFLVVLDEIDKLASNNSISDVTATKKIFELFLLAKVPDLNFILIGIANSLDMKDRLLARLNLRKDLLPRTLLFKPYSAEEMFEIISDRLSKIKYYENEEPIFNPMAIKFAAKKCSGNAGDLRKLFDVLRNSIEVLQLEMIATNGGLLSSRNLNKSSSNQIKKVGLQHVAKVFSSIMNASATKSRVNKLNLQQKIVLCSLVHREKSSIFQAHCSVDEAYDYYSTLLKKKDTLTPLKRDEFMESCNALETCGVASIFSTRAQGKTRHKMKAIKSTIDNKELNIEIEKIDLLKPFMVN